MATVAFNPEHPVSLSLRLFTFPSTGKFSGIQPTSKGAGGLQAEEKARRVLPFCTHSAFFSVFVFLLIKKSETNRDAYY